MVVKAALNSEAGLLKKPDKSFLCLFPDPDLILKLVLKLGVDLIKNLKHLSLRLLSLGPLVPNLAVKRSHLLAQ